MFVTHAHASLYDKTKARFGIYTSSWSFWYMVHPDRTNRRGHKSTQHLGT